MMTRGRTARTPPPAKKGGVKKAERVKKRAAPPPVSVRSGRFRFSVWPRYSVNPPVPQWGPRQGRNAHLLRQHANALLNRNAKHAANLGAAQNTHARELAVIRRELVLLKEELEKADRGTSHDVRRVDPRRPAPPPKGWFAKTIGGVKYIFNGTSVAGHLVSFTAGAAVGAVVTAYLTGGGTLLAATQIVAQHQTQSGFANQVAATGVTLTGQNPSAEHTALAVERLVGKIGITLRRPGNPGRPGRLT